MRRNILCLFAVFVFAGGVMTAQEGADINKLSLDLYLEMEGVSNPKLSSDGTQIVYTRSWVDKVNDRRESAIWVMNADGSRNRFLIDGSSPEWSPDGTRIAFVAPGEPRGQQIFVRWMDAEGAVTQITRGEEGPSNIMWAPDSNSIAFTKLVPGKAGWGIKLPERPRGAKWTPDPTVIETLVWRRDRIGTYKPGYNHIFLVPAVGGTARQVTSGDYHHAGTQLRGSGLGWAPEGREILFSGLRADDWEHQYRESEVYAVNTENGSIRQLTRRKGPDNAPVVSPNGRMVAYTGHDWTMQTYIDADIYVMGIDGSNPRSLTDSLDRAPSGLRWAYDSGGVYFTVSELGTSNLYFVSLQGDARKITDGNHMMSVSDINKNGKAVATLTAPKKPGDIVIFALNNPKPQQLTHVNDDILADVTLGDVEEIWYDSVGGLRVQGWIVKPPDFDANKKYPMMLAIHGGPHGMYNVGFNFGWQEHAANGYVVVYTNPRGSSGYGTEFGNEINNAYPSEDFDDLMKGVDTTIAKGSIDERNMFVYGCSGGGVLTAWVVGHTNRFAAASSNCPVIDWVSFVGTTDGNLGWYKDFKQYPWDDPSEHIKRSPLMYVGNVTTPTMLMTGELDLRTPMAQTEEFYHALKVLKVPTAMVRFKNEWHGTSRNPSNFLRTQLYLRHWFEKWATTDKQTDAIGGSASP